MTLGSGSFSSCWRGSHLWAGRIFAFPTEKTCTLTAELQRNGVHLRALQLDSPRSCRMGQPLQPSLRTGFSACSWKSHAHLGGEMLCFLPAGHKCLLIAMKPQEKNHCGLDMKCCRANNPVIWTPEMCSCCISCLWLLYCSQQFLCLL